MLIEGLAPGLDFRIRTHRKIALLVALTLVALSLTLMMPAAAEASPIYRTTSLGINSRACPEISGGRLVWQAEVNYADQIFTWTAADGQSQLTSADYYHPAGSPDVSGDRVVWYSTDGVWTWTPNDGPSLIGPGGGSSQVSGDRVVWTAGGEIFTWTPTGGPFPDHFRRHGQGGASGVGRPGRLAGRLRRLHLDPGSRDRQTRRYQQYQRASPSLGRPGRLGGLHRLGVGGLYMDVPYGRQPADIRQPVRLVGPSVGGSGRLVRA